jgi:peptide deformylase
MPEYTGEFPNPALVKLAKRMRMTMKLYAGLGLSANQCGVSERMFVIGTDEFQMTCINPKIVNQSETKIKTKEGKFSSMIGAKIKKKFNLHIFHSQK